MSRRDSGNCLFSGLIRRSLLQSIADLLCVPFVAEATSAWAQEKLAGAGAVVAFSWGGSHAGGVRQYVYELLTKSTGKIIVSVTAGLIARAILGFAPPLVVSEYGIDEIVELAYRVTKQVMDELAKESAA
ncbi:hypothetical protein IVB18_41610 [Bradyrhizobium sp. 186]|uniref:hypothetical protein n=1 Tax=Bradyrhizobium sp. 186 TaxID=2782654 RepID=UPI0020014874|nr:hypothetical protein [Bradyrhizobium sp. 186]UPK40737.1 hypothetical protein IVB18_41610 [Bradyrhizobium sp. 186]